MRTFILGILTLASSFVLAGSDTADTGVTVLHCEQITLAKSSYHIQLDQLNSGPNSNAFRGSLYFNVEPSPRVVFTECKGESKDALSCTEASKTWFLKTFTAGSHGQFIVAQASRTGYVPTTLDFICE